MVQLPAVAVLKLTAQDARNAKQCGAHLESADIPAFAMQNNVTF
jgi:hypothetical protein